MIGHGQDRLRFTFPCTISFSNAVTFRSALTQGAKPPFFRKTDMACCERLADGNHLYIYSGTQPRWTTLQFFAGNAQKAKIQDGRHKYLIRITF